MENSKSEAIKKVVDNFGRLSFMLETFVKLSQTGDHVVIASGVLEAAIGDSKELVTNLQEVKFEMYEKG